MIRLLTLVCAAISGICMDVGIDCHPDYRPFSYDEIKSKLDKKPGYLVAK